MDFRRAAGSSSSSRARAGERARRPSIRALPSDFAAQFLMFLPPRSRSCRSSDGRCAVLRGYLRRQPVSLVASSGPASCAQPRLRSSCHANPEAGPGAGGWPPPTSSSASPLSLSPCSPSVVGRRGAHGQPHAVVFATTGLCSARPPPPSFTARCWTEYSWERRRGLRPSTTPGYSPGRRPHIPDRGGRVSCWMLLSTKNRDSGHRTKTHRDGNPRSLG